MDVWKNELVGRMVLAVGHQRLQVFSRAFQRHLELGNKIAP